jgi:hypothetical protein
MGLFGSHGTRAITADEETLDRRGQVLGPNHPALAPQWKVTVGR